jgi:hypothetical protein
MDPTSQDYVQEVVILNAVNHHPEEVAAAAEAQKAHTELTLMLL